MSLYRLTGLIMLALLASCASSGPEQVAPKRPDWVVGQSAKFSPLLYLVGRGEGRSLEQAQNQARADLAKFFEVAIRETGTDTQQFTSSGGKDGAQQDLQQSVSRQLVTYTERVLQGVEIADHWQDPASANFYALAVASKPQTIERLRQEIGRMDEDTRKHIGQARNAEKPLARIAGASRAVKVQQQRVALQRSLQTLDPAGQGLPPPWSLVGLKSDRDALIERTRLKLELEEPPHGFSNVISSALARVGYRLEEATQPDYLIRATLKLEPAFVMNGWFWQRGQIIISLIEPGGAVVGNKQWPVKASAQQAEVVHGRVIEQVVKTLDAELAETLIGFAGE